MKFLLSFDIFPAFQHFYLQTLLEHQQHFYIESPVIFTGIVECRNEMKSFWTPFQLFMGLFQLKICIQTESNHRRHLVHVCHYMIPGQWHYMTQGIVGLFPDSDILAHTHFHIPRINMLIRMLFLVIVTLHNIYVCIL